MKLPPLGCCLAVLLAGATLQVGAADAVTAPSTADVVTVTTTDDLVNGDVSSPAALEAHPGSDGVSLREAITAVDAVSGPHAITFAPSLVGSTIRPDAYLPAFTQNDTTLVGLTDADGQPAVTLDASGNGNGCCAGLLAVYASNVTISHLRFVGYQGQELAIVVQAGDPGVPNQISGARIEDNVFDTNGLDGLPLLIGTDFPGRLKRCPSCGVWSGAVHASVKNVTVSGNIFSDLQGSSSDEIDVDLNGIQCTVQDLLVENNSFSGGQGAISVFPERSGNQVVGTQILRNSFSGNQTGVILGMITEGGKFASSGNVISGSVISQNTFANAAYAAIALNVNAQGTTATGDAIRSTEISNNLITGSGQNAVNLAPSLGPGASDDTIDGVKVADDTIASNATGLSIDGVANGNTVSNVDVLNTIFWSNGADFGGESVYSDPPTVATSITNDAQFASGNINADPRFVGPQDFDLQAGSPAIDAGTSTGAPSVDIEDRLRVGLPDIGAYEYGAAARPRLTVDYLAFAGTGTVTSSPAGINCPGTCSASFTQGTPVTLSASPGANSQVVWSGACTGSGHCSPTMNAAQSVTATFARLTHPLTVAISGNGHISSNPAGISCPGTCSLDMGQGDPSITLSAEPASGYAFTGWSGDCTGTDTCNVSTSTTHSVTATFTKSTPPPQCHVPKVIGKSLRAARSAIHHAHCSLGAVKKHSSAKKKGIVIAQSPAPRKTKSNGARVNLTVSKGKKH